MAEGANTEWRSAEPADDDAIIRMCLALNAEDPENTHVPPEQVHRTLDVLRVEPTRGKAVVAEIDGQVVGSAPIPAMHLRRSLSVENEP